MAYKCSSQGLCGRMARPKFRLRDQVTLAPQKSVIPPYDGKPWVLRDTLLTVSSVYGTGTLRKRATLASAPRTDSSTNRAARFYLADAGSIPDNGNGVVVIPMADEWYIGILREDGSSGNGWASSKEDFSIDDMVDKVRNLLLTEREKN